MMINMLAALCEPSMRSVKPIILLTKTGIDGSSSASGIAEVYLGVPADERLRCGKILYHNGKRNWPIKKETCIVVIMLAAIAVATFFATLLGGLFALRFKDSLHLVLGFSAGAVIGVAFFDLLPEAISLGSTHFDVGTITAIVAFAFVVYLFLDRFVLLHAHTDEEGHPPADSSRAGGARGILGAGSLSLHSFLDGVGIGFAFQVSPAVGAIVAAAVLTHDFSDGINTVNMILKNGGSRQKAFRWLFTDALAPVLGIVSTFFFVVPQQTLGIILATFCGFFIYIGASDLLPESHHRHPTLWTTAMTALGIAVLYVAVSLAHL